MILVHFSDHPHLMPLRRFDCDVSHEPRNALWVSDESAIRSWSTFCADLDYRPSRLVYRYLVLLRESPRNLYITNSVEFDEFEANFGVLPGADENGVGPIRCIDWCQVAEHYDSVIVSPYQQSKAGKAFTESQNWYATWDVASGVILAPEAVNRITPAAPSNLVFSCEICGNLTFSRRDDQKIWCRDCSKPERLRSLAKVAAQRIGDRLT